MVREKRSRSGRREASVEWRSWWADGLGRRAIDRSVRQPEGRRNEDLELSKVQDSGSARDGQHPLGTTGFLTVDWSRCSADAGHPKVDDLRSFCGAGPEIFSALGLCFWGPCPARYRESTAVRSASDPPKSAGSASAKEVHSTWTSGSRNRTVAPRPATGFANGQAR